MASSRKKQDENNLKTLRELAALPQNKFCFDCGQRGPTYVNVTVGSFVCTKCSGILRGITPPHRVKSISMATFTSEEIDTIRNKGNDYCRKVWLGLHEGSPPTFSDELQVRDFMIEKYEKKRFFLEKAMTKPEVPNTRPSWTPPTINGTNSKLSNGLAKKTSNNNVPNGTVPNGIITNGTSRSRPEVKNHQQNGVINNNNLGNSFAVDFDKADIFSNTSASSTGSSQSGFADFEHNQVYNASNNPTTNDRSDDFSIFDLQFTSFGPTLNQVPLFPRCPPSNRWSMPTPSALNAWAAQKPPLNPQNGVGGAITAPLVNSTPPPVEDKYAALKDLDNEMKQQQQTDVWSSSNTGSTGSLYSSSTPNTGSVYGSPSPQGSIFGSPSQGQFMSAFTNLQDANPQLANPFGNNPSTAPWATSNGFTNNSNGFANSSTGFTNGLNNITNGISSMNVLNGIQTTQAQSGYVNPFREPMGKVGGFTNGFQQLFPSNGLNGAWGGNPFKVGTVATTMNPNNPFL